MTIALNHAANNFLAMPVLSIIRHAKSSWDKPDTGDHDRTLNGRGFHAAPLMGRWLFREGWPAVGAEVPGHWCSSTATRARLTAEIIAGECGLPLSVVTFDRNLYLAPEDDMLDVVREFPPAAHAVIFGHNPGLEDLVNRLLAGGAIPHFKTAAVACLRVPGETWGDLRWNSAELLFHRWPAGLEA